MVTALMEMMQGGSVWSHDLPSKWPNTTHSDSGAWTEPVFSPACLVIRESVVYNSEAVPGWNQSQWQALNQPYWYKIWVSSVFMVLIESFCAERSGESRRRWWKIGKQWTYQYVLNLTPYKEQLPGNGICHDLIRVCLLWPYNVLH